MAHWLDTVCRPFDHAVFAAIHRFAMAAGDFFTPLMSVITTLGDGGIAFILLGILPHSRPQCRGTGRKGRYPTPSRLLPSHTAF